MPGVLVWLRWAQFVDLALILGVPLTAWLLGERRLGGLWRGTLGLGSMAGFALAIALFLVTLAGMTGGPVAELDRATIMMMACHSALGWSVMLRLMACAGALILVACGRRVPTGPLALLGGVAAATLAWGGHAAASQGASGWLRLVGDIAHLWCGLTWLGALMLFVVWLWRESRGGDGKLPLLRRGLSAFAVIGGVLVGVVTISGVANLLFLAEPAQWGQSIGTLYGQLICAKLVMVGLMVLLASDNRFRLVPALDKAADSGACMRAVLALRNSITVEAALALGVVLCVAWAGTLDPGGMPT